MIKLTVADVDCGVSKMAFRNGRIVNGLDVTEGEFPWYLYPLAKDPLISTEMFIFYNNSVII